MGAGNLLTGNARTGFRIGSSLDLDEQGTRQLLEASLTALAPYWNVPYQRNPFFTGRDNVLCQIHELLCHEHNALLNQSCALSGLGGIGKTQTVIEYAYRYANDYSAIFWVAGQTSEGIVSSFVALANVLNLPGRQFQEQSHVVEAVLRWLTTHSRWLLIFDNVEDIALIKSFLPAARCGSLLFTSRRQAFEVAAQVLSLEPMTSEEGMRFLLGRARFSSDLRASRDLLAPEDEEALQKIVSLMDGLPLALDQVGSYIEATRCRLSDYLQLYQSSQQYFLDGRDAHADHPLSVTRTFTLIFEQLEQSHAPAAELLTVCAFLAPEAIPEAFFREGAASLGPELEALITNPLAFHTTISVLLAYSLLQRNPGAQTVTVHRLVQEVLKGSLSKAAQQMWASHVICAMSHLFPSLKGKQANDWQRCEQLLPHALVCITLSEQWDNDETERLTLMNRVATYLRLRARYAEAEPLLQRALSICERTLGVEHPQVARLLNNLALLYQNLGKYEQAKLLFQRGYTSDEQNFGVADHPDVVSSLNNLAEFYREQGKYEQS